jgi:hypothetical protein
MGLNRGDEIPLYAFPVNSELVFVTVACGVIRNDNIDVT